MGNPLSAEHKRKISEALKRNRTAIGGAIVKAAPKIGTKVAQASFAAKNPIITGSSIVSVGASKVANAAIKGKVLDTIKSATASIKTGDKVQKEVAYLGRRVAGDSKTKAKIKNALFN